MQHRSSEPISPPADASETTPAASGSLLSATPLQGHAPALGAAERGPATAPQSAAPVNPGAQNTPAAAVTPLAPPVAKPAAGPTGPAAATQMRPVPLTVARPETPATASVPPRPPAIAALARPVPENPTTPAAKPAVVPPAVPPVAPASAAYPARASASRARFQKRHWLVLISFLLVVVLPSGVAAWYLWARAADQYASTVGFSVRTEESGSALGGLLGGLTGLSGSSSKDTDILYEFLQSQKLVADMDAGLDLQAMWSIPDNDPIFAFDSGASGASIEDLLAYWNRMVQVHYDAGAGLIEVRVLAFTAADAHDVAAALFEESSDMINNLSAIAREDAIRYSREELAAALDRLKEARQVVTEFRTRNQMVDPSVDIQTQAGLLGMLQGQLAEALIDVDMLRDTTRDGDPRMTQAQRRVEVIQERIAAERAKMGISGAGNGSEAFASLVGEYERLAVDREFAEKTYISALATYDTSLAEARRKSRYLAAYVEPTEAETARYPRRLELLGVLSLFLFLAWAIAVLVGYSLRDRR